MASLYESEAARTFGRVDWLSMSPTGPGGNLHKTP